jgi:hypothetical protein
MDLRRCFTLTVAMLGFAVTGAATAPQATGTFVRVDRVTKKWAVIDSAYLGEKDVCFDLESTFTPDGDHVLQVTIYDGGGREVYQARSTVTARRARWGDRTCVEGDVYRDLAGTWWYVAELDGEPLVERSLKVEALR